MGGERPRIVSSNENCPVRGRASSRGGKSQDLSWSTRRRGSSGEPFWCRAPEASLVDPRAHLVARSSRTWRWSRTPENDRTKNLEKRREGNPHSPSLNRHLFKHKDAYSRDLVLTVSEKGALCGHIGLRRGGGHVILVVKHGGETMLHELETFAEKLCLFFWVNLVDFGFNWFDCFARFVVCTIGIRNQYQLLEDKNTFE